MKRVRKYSKKSSKNYKRTNIRSIDDIEVMNQNKWNPARAESDPSKIIKSDRRQYHSEGEQMINKYLTSLGIKFVQEKSFRDCINPETQSELRFDFWIPKNKLAIEYDGYQHRVRPKSMTISDFNKGQYRDNLKDQYCKSKGIELLRIPSYNKDILHAILDRALGKRN